MKHKHYDKQNDFNVLIIRRLDAIIRLIAETLYTKKGKATSESDVIRMLHSTGLSPTEISKILGKKDRRSISPALYTSNKKIKTNLNQKNQEDTPVNLSDTEISSNDLSN